MSAYQDIARDCNALTRAIIAEIPEKGCIVGIPMHGHPVYFGPNDNLHFPMGDAFYKYGVKGIAEKAFKNAESAGEEEKEFLTLLGEVYLEIADFFKRTVAQLDEMITNSDDARLLRMRKNMAAIADGKPETFEQAVQLFYLMWRLRNVFGTSCIGRLDVALGGFYENDVKNGIITEDEAQDILCDLWERLNTCGTGDTLINVMVGGRNEDGSDASNRLSVLMLEATRRVKMPEPHMNVRFHKNMPAELREKAFEVQLLGHGQATVYNDEIIIPALVKAGIPENWACRYTNDGCTEIIIDGGSMINFDHIDAVSTLEITMNNGKLFDRPEDQGVRYWHKDNQPSIHRPDASLGFESGDVTECKTFDEFYNVFLSQYKYQALQCCEGLKLRHEYRVKEHGSFILNGTFDFVLDSGRDMIRGMPVECYQIFSGSIPTVADGIAAIKKVVYDDKKYTMTEVMDALAANFEGHDEIRSALLAAPKFGNDIDEVDLIAADIAKNFCDWLEEFSRDNGILIWPSLVGWLFLQEAYGTWATPDGRKWKDPIAEHYCATPGRALNGPTALINSIGKADLGRAFGVAAVHISIPKMLNLPREQQMTVMETLVDAGIEKGLSMFNIAAYDVEELKAAQKDPDSHADLIVRVWGYSARFVDLCTEMQDHIISRVSTQGS